MKHHTLLIITIWLNITFSCTKKEDTILKEISEELYFPSINSSVWETKSITELNWNENELQPLLNFLEEKNTKSFIILFNGKIVVEEYFNNHNVSSPWYWASASKTLTSTIAGIAQDKGALDLNNKVSDYIETDWTSTSLEKEYLITCQNLLSMNSGLDDTLGNEVSPSNLKYVADSETRWAYHNVYVKMQDVVAEATNTSWGNYFNLNLKDKIGMTGSWTDIGSLSVYWSNTRSMARFGLMVSAKGKWKNTEIVSEQFLNEATNTSQDINKSYGYLWWLNGKSSYHLPQSQLKFSGSLIPNATDDLIAALGKNDQKIYIVPSKKLVIIRMGEAADNSNFALSTFDVDLWEKINALIN